MKNIRQFHLLSSILGGVFLFSSCSVVPKAEEKNLSEQWPVVASYQWAGQDSVVVCDLSLLKDTVDLPFSFFLKDFQIIKLDNRDEAMVGENNLCVSENYILVYGSVYELHPCRLFTKKGEFVTNIGAIGQGPGEYRAVYKAGVDEEGHAAIAALNEKEIDGKTLAVSVARPREEGPRRNSNYGGGNRGGYGNNRGGGCGGGNRGGGYGDGRDRY